MNNEGWKRAAIAWEVCASIHREYAKGKDALFTTRQKDFVNAANKARVKAQAPTPPVQQDDEALEPDMQSAWISVQDRMPPDDTPVLVYVPGNEMLAFAIDQWQMQREAPLGWSSATIETGMGWGDHDYEDVSHWMPLTAPGHPLAMPAQAQALRLPEPMTDEEVAALIAETEYLPTDHAVRYLVETGECRVKEANE